MPPAPALPPGPWVASIAATFTAFASPGGTVFTRNLTPDKETGLGDWTVEEFIATMKTGRERGKGRPVLPPMPVQNLKALSDSDIRALFAYLQSIPAIKNRTPQPIEPPDAEVGIRDQGSGIRRSVMKILTHDSRGRLCLRPSCAATAASETGAPAPVAPRLLSQTGSTRMRRR